MPACCLESLVNYHYELPLKYLQFPFEAGWGFFFGDNKNTRFQTQKIEDLQKGVSSQIGQ